MKIANKKKAERLGLRLIVQGGLANRGRTAATDTTDTDDCGDDTDPTDPSGPMGGAPAQRRSIRINAIGRSYNFGEAA